MTLRAPLPLSALIAACLLFVAVSAAVQQPADPGSPPAGEAGAPVDVEPAEEGAGAPLVAVDRADPEAPPAPGAATATGEGGSGTAAEPGTGATAEEAGPAEEDRMADFYLSRCAGCHTIGEGDLSGPDLAPSTEWPDDDLATAVERMEKNVGPMTAEQVDGLVELLQDPEVKQRLSAARERQVEEMAASMAPPSPSTGRELFHGGETFENGGIACAACHRAGENGGILAVDLTGSYERLGEQALVSAAASPGFPLMKAAYGERPVTRQEAVHLAAYLEELGEEVGDGEEAAAAAPPSPVGLWGAAAAAVLVASLLFLYRGRNRGVRAELVRAAMRR